MFLIRITYSASAQSACSGLSNIVKVKVTRLMANRAKCSGPDFIFDVERQK
jgi:hypothetical protein